MYKWLTLLLIGSVNAGIPECTSQVDQCELVVDENFGDAMSLLRDDQWKKVKDDSSLRNALCDPGNWERMSAECGVCPMNLEITEPLHLRGMKICLQENDFIPYNPDTHLDKFHHLHGKELDIITTNGYFCTPENWPENGFNKIAIVPDLRGCWQGNPMHRAVEGNYSAVITVTTSFLISSGLGIELPGFKYQNRPTQVGAVPAFGWGKTDGNTMKKVVVSTAQEHPDINAVLALAEMQNVTVRGKLTLDCSAQERFLPSDNYFSDSCPSAYMVGKDICEYQQSDTSRLCSRCPIELSNPNNQSAVPFACLYGPDFLPFKKENFFESVFGTSITPGSHPIVDMERDVYMITSMTGDMQMCFTKGWPADAAGRIVAVTIPDPLYLNCNWVQVVEAAEAAGILAIILINTKLPGLSKSVTIPVGSVFVHQKEFENFFASPDAIKDANGTMRSIRFKSGVLSPNLVQVEKEIEIPEETSSDMLSEPGILVSVIVSPIVIIITIGKAYHTAKSAVRLPSSDGLPMGATLICVMVTLTLICAGVSMGLAVASSQEALDTSSANSMSALDLTKTANAENVKALAVLLLEEIVHGAIAAFDRWQVLGRFNARTSANFIAPRDKVIYDWLEFYHEFTFSLTRIIQADEAGWRTQVYTNAGLYYDSFGMTNNWIQHRNGTHKIEWKKYPEMFNNDEGFIANTSNGWLYDYYSKYATVIKREFFDPYTRISTCQLPRGFGNAYEYAADIFETHTSAAIISRYNWQYPIARAREEVAPFYSFLEPLYVGGGNLRKVSGGIAVSMSVDKLWEVLRGGATSKTGATQIADSITLALFRVSDGMLVAADSEDLYEKVAYFNGGGTEASDNLYPYFITRLHNVRDTPNVAISSLANKLITEHKTLNPDVIKGKLNIRASQQLSIDFDQGGFEAPDPATLYLKFDGNIDDTSLSKFPTEFLGSCDGCYSSTGIRGSSLEFNGNLTIRVLPFITTKSLHVANTKIETIDGKWMSHVKMLNRTDTVQNISDVIMVAQDSYGDSGYTPLYGDVFHYHQSFSISVYINPNKEIKSVEKETEKARLFTDSRQGDGAVRWYADGSLKVSVVRHGCTTAPLSIPVNEWSHLTAVVSFSKQYCVVYLNGQQVSRGKMTSNVQLPLFGTGYYIGDQFSGKIDILKVYKRVLSPEEVLQIYNSPDEGPIRQVSKKWSAVLSSIGEEDDYIGKLVMVALVPTTDITREVDRNNAIVSERLRIQEKNTQTKLDANQVEAASSIVIMVVVFSLLLLVFTDYVTKPFAKFALRIYAASKMHVDGVEEDITYPLRELQIMHSALVILMENLRHFKSFVPINLVEDIGNVTTEPEDDTSSKKSASQGSSVHTVSDGSGSFHAAKIQPLTQLSLLKKKLSFVQINTLNWHGELADHTPSSIIERHALYLITIIEVVMANKGVPDTFSGDRVLAAYNGVKSCVGFQVAACVSALTIKDSLKGWKLSISVTAGDCRVGYMGTNAMKRYSYVGSVIGWTFSLERLCKQLHCGILADHPVCEAIIGHVSYRTRGAASCAKHNGITRIHQILSLIEVDNDEWMYMLDKAQNNPIFLWNKIWESIGVKQWSSAEKDLENYCKNISKEVVSPTEREIIDEVEMAIKRNDYIPVSLDNY